MMRRSPRRHDLVAGIAAGTGLLLLVAGVPTALMVGVGWPLPHAMPQVETVMAALRYGQIAPTTLLQALALVAWLAWAAITFGIVLEVAAVLRGTVARALPGLGPVQQLAARLVAAVMLVSSVTTRAAAEPPPIPQAARIQVEAPDAVDVPVPPRPVEQQRPSGPWWTVRRHDSLWSIAERTLGDGHRWKEIAARNIDRAQPDGGRLRRGDTLIRPGWQLELPQDADVPAPPTRVTVTAGDDLWSLAEEHLGDGDRWREIHARNRGRPQPDGGRLDDPELIRPGWVLHLPSRRQPSDVGAARTRAQLGAQSRLAPGGDDGPDHGPDGRRARRGDDPTTATAPVPKPVTPATLPPAGSTPAADEGVHASEPPPSRSRPHLAPTRSETRASGPSAHRNLTPVATAVLAAALVGLLAHRRRHWLQRREAGAVPAAVDPEAAELERWLRSMADHDLTHRIDRVLCVLAEHFAEHGLAPQVRAVELGEDVVLHLVAADGAAPPLVTVADQGRRWIVAAELEMASTTHDRRYVRSFISCGRRDTGALLLLDPMAVAGVGVTGPDHVVADAMTSWTTELAATGAARGVELVVVGAHHPLVERLARVSISSDPAAVLERIARQHDAAEHTEAGIVVLCGSGVADADVDALVAAAAHPAVGVVVAGGATSATRVELDSAGARLWPDDVRLEAPEWLTPDDWDRFGDLLRPTARSHAPAPAPPALRPVLAHGDVRPEAATDEIAHVVGLLGPLTIDGRAPAIDAAASELLTWLAVHRTGADPGTLLDLLQPGRARDPASLERAIGRIDAVLDAGAGSVVVHTDDGRLELRDSVSTDLACCDRLLRGLDHQPPPVQARNMYAALDLVRGEPFVDSGAWAHADGTALRTTGTVIDIAHRLAMQSLTIGDVERAAWAAGRGLLAAPTNELLHRDRMRIADMAGDAAGIDTCMRQLRLRVEADGGWLTPETEALYRQLRGTATLDVEQDAS